jgi:tetratricopeptide (TPR) repeat protein
MSMEKINISELEEKYRSSSNRDERFELHKQYLAYLKKQVEQNPGNVSALVHLGMLSWEPFHKQEEAIDYLKEAIKYDPQNIDARFWLAKCYYHDYCEYDQAKQLLLEALKIDPNRSDCLSLIAMIVWNVSDDWTTAISYLERAVQEEPGWPELRRLLVLLYLEIKDIPSAEYQAKKLEELAKIPPKKSRNYVEDYYETIVTGRGHNKKTEDLERLKERIKKANVLSGGS